MLKSLQVSRQDQQLWTLVAGIFINSIGYYIAFPFLTIYLYSVRGLSMSSIGLALMISCMAGGVTQYLGGLLCDRIGRKFVLCSGVLLQSLVLLLLSFSILSKADFPIFFVLLVAVEACGGFYRSIPFVVVSDVCDSPSQTTWFGLLQMATNAGTAIGPLLGGLIAMWSYTALFALTAGACFIYFIFIFLFLVDTIPRHSIKRNRRSGAIFNDRRFIIFCLISGALSIVYAQLMTTFSSYMSQAAGLSEGQIGLLISVYGVLLVIFQYPAARAIRRIGELRSLVISAILFAVGFGAAGIFVQFWQLAVSVGIIALAMLLYMPASVTIVVRMANDTDRGEYISISRVIGRSGFAFGPMIGGFLLDSLAHWEGLTWVIMAAIAVSCSLGFLLMDNVLFRSGHSPETPEAEP